MTDVFDEYKAIYMPVLKRKLKNGNTEYAYGLSEGGTLRTYLTDKDEKYCRFFKIELYKHPNVKYKVTEDDRIIVFAYAWTEKDMFEGENI